jgi:hypothetical protein
MRALFALPVMPFLASLAILLAPGAAAADDTDLELRDLPLSIGVNSPYSWLKEGDKGFGVSVSYGLSRHFAVRGNYARYGEDGPTLGIIGEIMGGESATYGGSVEDFGLSLVYYPRRLWDGPMVEVGALRRQRDSSVRDEFALTRTTTLDYAGRAMVGWSWRFASVMYVAVAIGISAGRERGLEVSAPEFGMPTTRVVDGAGVDTEGYLRFGFAFGRR